MPEELTQQIPRPLVRLAANAAEPGGAADVISGVLTDRLFQILVEGSQQAGAALENLRFGVILIGMS